MIHSCLETTCPRDLSTFWSLGIQDKFSSTVNSSLPGNLWCVRVLFTSCITEMRSRVCQRFSKCSRIVARRLSLEKYTWRVSLAFSLLAHTFPNRILPITSFVSGMSANFSLNNVFISAMKSPLWSSAVVEIFRRMICKVNSSPVGKTKKKSRPLT